MFLYCGPDLFICWMFFEVDLLTFLLFLFTNMVILRLVFISIYLAFFFFFCIISL